MAFRFEAPAGELDGQRIVAGTRRRRGRSAELDRDNFRLEEAVSALEDE